LIIGDINSFLSDTSAGTVSIDLLFGLLETNGIEDPWVVNKIEIIMTGIETWIGRNPET
jgi:hypothetical protein